MPTSIQQAVRKIMDHLDARLLEVDSQAYGFLWMGFGGLTFRLYRLYSIEFGFSRCTHYTVYGSRASMRAWCVCVFFYL